MPVIDQTAAVDAIPVHVDLNANVAVAVAVADHVNAHVNAHAHVNDFRDTP